MARAVIFDAMGTLFDLAPARERLVAAGAPAIAFEAWFGRSLHAAAALTLAGEFRPFPQIAEATLRSVLAQAGLEAASAEEIAAALREARPYPDAAPALERLAEAGVAAAVLTNGSRDATEEILERGGIRSGIAAIVTTADVQVYKPHPDTYRRVLSELGLGPSEVAMVAAHAWDAVGARAVGIEPVWVSRLERRWPLPVTPVPEAPGLVEAVDLVLGHPSPWRVGRA